MSRWEITIWSDADRAKARQWLSKATRGMRITFAEAKRTNDQNAALWPLLSQISVALPWHGQRLTPEDWKTLFMAALNTEMRMVPNLNNNGFVALGRSTSKLSKGEFSQLLELIHAFAAEHGVVFSDPKLSDDLRKAA